MNRFTKKFKVEDYDRLHHQCWINDLALGCVVRGDVAWSPWIKESGGGKYRIGHAGAYRADSGYMVEVFRYDDQQDRVQAYAWEDQYRAVMSNYSSEYCEVIRQCIWKISYPGKAKAADPEGHEPASAA